MRWPVARAATVAAGTPSPRTTLMRDLIKQLASTFGALFAAACCLGVTAVVSALTAVGAGFLIRDAVLIPLYIALLALSLWLLYRSAKAHGGLAPFWLGLAGALVAFAGLWINPVLVYAGLLAIVAANVGDFIRGRRRAA
jgi:mercuric ion transport protein